MTTPSRSPTKRLSLASSASQSRPSVRFDDDSPLVASYPDDSSLKKRLLTASVHPPYNSSLESRRNDYVSPRGRLSTVSSPTKLSDAPSLPKIDDTTTPKKDDSPWSRRRHSIMLSPTKQSVVASHPKVDPTRPMNNHDSPPRKRRPSIVLPVTTTTSVPNIHQMTSKSPRKRRFSTISPPLPDPIHDTSISSPYKRRTSSEDKSQHDPSFFPQTTKLCIIPPSTNKPPAQVCAEINQRIRSTFHYPDFDFIQHVQHRSYVVRTQYFRESECVTMLDSGVDDLLQRMFEKLPPQPNNTTMNIDIRASPGKGLGMFSRKHISNGESFFIEYPTIITPYVIGLSTGLSALYADIFGKLSGPVFRELMDLSSFSSIPSDEAQDVHEAIMRINALAIELPVPSGDFSELNTHRAIFLQTSRCNHSCGPNSKWEWDPKRFSLVLTAVRPIKVGEEITIPYVATNLTSKERQDILSNFYRFKCLCSLCVVDVPSDDDNDDTDDDGDDDDNDDDDTQSDISSPISTTHTETKQKTKTTNSETSNSPSSLLPSFEKWCLDPTLPDDILINAHTDALQFIIEQDINDDHRHDPTRDPTCDTDNIKHLDAITMCYGALEDIDNFRKWMERVSEVRSRVNPKQQLVCNKWLSNPTTFPVWGWRRVFCDPGDAAAAATTTTSSSSSSGGGGGGEGEDSDSGLSTCVSMGMFNFI